MIAPSLEREAPFPPDDISPSFGNKKHKGQALQRVDFPIIGEVLV